MTESTVHRGGDEAGMAMITAILVSMVVLFLGVVATGLSDHSFSSTRVDQKRVTTFHAAEAGIDHALQVLQTTPLASLPCASPLARSLGGGAYAPDYLVTFTYFTTYPVSGAAMACPLASEAAAVVLRSSGGSSDPLGPDRAVEAVVHLSVPTDGAFDRTVFSDRTVEYEGAADLIGDGTRAADLYTNGSINCDFGGLVFGNLVAQGDAALSRGCGLTGSIHAKGTVTAATNVHVGGDMTSSTSSVAITASSSVFGNTRAATTVSVDASSTVLGLRNDASPSPAPAAAAFPNPTYTAANWTTAGYTLVSPATCADAVTALTTSAPTWTNPTVVHVTGCRVEIPAGTTIELEDHVVLVADGGIQIGGSTRFKTSPTAPPGTRLSLFVPFGSACSGNGRIVMTSAVTFEPPLEVFAYTPCLLQVHTAGTTMYGQLYGGRVRFGGPTRIRHAGVGSIPGYLPPAVAVTREVTVASPPREVTP